MLDCLLYYGYYGHVLKCGARSSRTQGLAASGGKKVKQRGLRLDPLAGFDLTTIGGFQVTTEALKKELVPSQRCLNITNDVKRVPQGLQVRVRIQVHSVDVSVRPLS